MRLVLCLLGLWVLAACATGGGSPERPSPEQLSTIAYSHDAPPSLTLITVVNNRTGAGGHSALMVNGSQRVIFDPAGSFRIDLVPEFGDVLYGISPRILAAYKSAHARSTFRVVTQEIPVSPAVAERALQLVEANGPVPGAFCANATSGILRQLPGFEDTRVTFYPVTLHEQIATRPGVRTDTYFENDAGDIVDGVAAATVMLQ